MIFGMIIDRLFFLILPHTLGVFLAIGTNITVLLMTGFVVQGHNLLNIMNYV